MSWKDKIKRLKLFHWAYNLWHYRSLRHNRSAYLRFGIRKPLFASISSKDFTDKQSHAWLDKENSSKAVLQKPSFFLFNNDFKQKIAAWSDKGYMIFDHFFDTATVESINIEISDLIKKRRLKFTNGNKLMFAHRKSKLIREIVNTPRLLSILEFILDKKVLPFQTINFITGSEQKAHSDSIHMTTYPLGYLIAVWIALEDITPENGPLFYYPGSHRLPFLLNSEYNQESTLLALGKKQYSDYETALQQVLVEKKYTAQNFLAKKGDILIWHANLVHGGAPIIDPSTTRKSMVIHYYASDVVKYHEITERPSHLK